MTTIADGTPGAWAFDVDGTLIGSIRSDQLRPGAADLLGWLDDHGATIVVWSAGGADYARRMAEAHEITHHVDAFYGKEQRDESRRYVIDHFEPIHRPDVFVDDVPEDLPPEIAVKAVSQFFGGNEADRELVLLLESIRSDLIVD